MTQAAAPIRPAPHGASAGGHSAARISEEASTMARTDIHLDARLRHLGATYPESPQKTRNYRNPNVTFDLEKAVARAPH